jgi:thioredoxin reductase
MVITAPKDENELQHLIKTCISYDGPASVRYARGVSLGVPMDPESGVPAHDPLTMATPVPGVYLAGVIASGFQANRIFIENGRDHGDMIVADLQSYF